MDLTTIIGIAAGLVALIGGFLLEGGQIGGLLQLTAAIIVFGGTFAAVAVSFPYSKLKQLPAALRFAFTKQTQKPEEVIDQLVDMAMVARREGVLALERSLPELDNVYMRDGLQMVIDGTDPELTKNILALEIDSAERKWEQQAKMLESAGGYAPTMGIIGTVMGLIRVLSNLSDPSSLGHSIAVAFTATLYGVASANIVYLPLGTKIKAQAAEQTLLMELILEGILSVQAGENPQLIRKKLSALLQLEPGERRREKVPVYETQRA
ncbi:flagellar motor protein [Paenibacillus sp. MMS18-CY102]|uniref:flagellar motor protein n=1 Tax=Paenibacillus sp. MMS18-CY102 TaxID=2682849 RepID=UPI001365C3A6|nr:flagellar motor protein [Paenibacillus sp. MMS18-CY102]MWC30568.1 flagellar motor protein [Paenibacillus sp. MMS18-CY102]